MRGQPRLRACSPARKSRLSAHAAGLALGLCGLADATAQATAQADAPSPAPSAPLATRLLDDLRDASAWKASASDQVRAGLVRDRDGSLCLEADFGGVSGYAVMRRELPVDWPEHFELTARVKGSGAVNDIQLKLVDASGDNVWWVNRPDHRLPGRLSDWSLRQRHVSFAWGPAADRTLRQTRHLEWVIAAGREGGKSRACLARLSLQARAPDPNPWPAPVARLRGHALQLDWRHEREFNGLQLQWPAGVTALHYRVDGSPDGLRWQALREVKGSDGGSDALWLPETRARHLRVTLLSWHRRMAAGGAAAAEVAAPALPAAAAAAAPAPRPPAVPATAATPNWPVPRVALRSASEWPDRNAVFAAEAALLPQGDMPRAFRGQQSYWTLVGVDGGGSRSGLLSEDGAIELGRGGPSLEPALLLDGGRRITWAQATGEHRLREGYLPLPSVHWRHDGVELSVEAGADGPRTAAQLLALYTVRNTGAKPRRVTLLLALRPWQVNPPQQFLTTPGGFSPLARLRWDGRRLHAGQHGPVTPWPLPRRVSALPLDGGLSLEALAAGPTLRQLDDPQQAASAAFQWSFDLAPGEQAQAGWTAALAAETAAGGSGASGPRPAAGTSASAGKKPHPNADPAFDGPSLVRRLDRVADAWRARLNRVTLRLPREAQPLADTLRSLHAQILMSRDGPALRPGTRSYARTWVRDGAMMAAALLQLGEEEAAREFLEWFAPRVFASGKVPCCVDHRGADPVAENDSHGQFLYAVAELWRHTQDHGLLERHWPTVQRVVAYMESLRQSERVPANRTPGREHLFGLMPPSISHEGYSDKPAYSYWDSFWALRGYKDAVQMAQALGHTDIASRWAGWRDSFASELAASVTASARHHAIGHVAGAADRGDFDATSTTVALNPAQARLPDGLLAGTFERYWDEARTRAQGLRRWRDYTPYELRSIGALVRLGQGERAHALIDFFWRDQRPAGWNQWAEVVLPDAREPRFLGDMPHAWVAADGIRSLLDMLALDREAEATVVLGAGLRAPWLGQGEIAVSGLSTPLGRVSWRLTPTSEGWLFELGDRPRAAREVRLSWPAGLPLPQVSHAGRALQWTAARELSVPDSATHLQLLRPPADPGLPPASP